MYKKYADLKELRGVTDYAVAKSTGISPSVFTDWKKGKSQPKADKLLKLADYFGVTMDYFYSEESQGYYVNEETARRAQEMFDNPQMSILMDTVSKASPEQMDQIIAMAQILMRGSGK